MTTLSILVPPSRRRTGRSCLALACTMLSCAAWLAGCVAVGPDFKPPRTDQPPDWPQWRAGMPELRAAAQGASAAPAGVTDWSIYDDAVLAGLQREALASNADLRTAALHYAQSRLQERMVRASYSPQLDLQAGIARERQSESGAATRVAGALGGAASQSVIAVLSQPFTLRQAGFDASWEPDLWGHIARSVEAAKADSRVSSALLDDARLSILAEVARSYFDLRAARRLTQVLAARVDNARQSRELIDARHARGLVDATAVDSAAAGMAELQAALPGLQAQQEAALNRLAILLERPPAQLEPLLGADPAEKLAAPLPDLSAGLPAELARHRPDIAAAEARLHAATARIGLAVADLYPRIVLGASFGFESVDGGKFGEWGSRTWSVGPTLNLPLFDYGRRRATVQLRDLQAQEAAVAYQHTVLAAWRDLDDALNRYGAERLRNAQLRQRCAQEREIYALARARRTRGMSSDLAVLEAQRSLLVAEQDLAASDGTAGQSLAAVIKAVGGSAGG